MKDLISTFAAQFKAASLTSLVDSFNRQVQNRGWNSVRAVHDRALMAELIARSVDVSAVHNGQVTSFAHTVRLDENSNKLVIEE